MMNCPRKKKAIFFSAYLLVAVQAFPQTLDEVRQMAGRKQLLDARDGVERFLGKPGNEGISDAWYLKGYIYKSISENDSLKVPLTEPGVIAFESYKKCLELDAKNKWMLAEQYQCLFSLYNYFFSRAAKCYRAADYNCAFDHFVHAGNVQQYIYKKNFSYRGFKFTAVDTGLLANTATSAFKAGRKTEGIVYYAKLADARIRDAGYLQVYHALVEYFISVKDEIAFRKYLKIGRELFPYDVYWVEAEVSMVKSKGLNAALIRSYEEKLRRDPDNFNLNYTFCTELFNMLFSSETNTEDHSLVQKKLEQRLETTLALPEKGVSAELLVARYYFNNARNLQGAANELPAETNKEKLQEEYSAQFEKARSHAHTVYQYYEQRSNLTRGEIESYKIAANILSGVADILGQTEAANTYRNRIVEIAKMIPVRQ